MLEHIIAQIPQLVAGLISNIYVINRNNDELYRLAYTGDKIKIIGKTTLQTLPFSADVLDSAIQQEMTQFVFPIDGVKRAIFLTKIDDYHILFIIDLTKDNIIKEENAVKKLPQRLLIMDDSPVITNFFKKVAGNDYEVLVASNGQEGIKLINEYKDDDLAGIFLDLQMPIMDGYQVLDYLKAQNLLEQIPVSVISGEDSKDGIERVTNYPICDMLQKPFSAESAKAIIAKTVQFGQSQKD